MKHKKYPTMADILSEPDSLKRRMLIDQRVRSVALMTLLSGAEPLSVRRNEYEELGEQALSPTQLERLTADHTYHRPENHSWTLELVARFVEDELAWLAPIYVSLRPDGSWVVVDGWHRVCAARLCNKSLQARFIRPANFDVERKLFLVLNSGARCQRIKTPRRPK